MLSRELNGCHRSKTHQWIKSEEIVPAYFKGRSGHLVIVMRGVRKILKFSYVMDAAMEMFYRSQVITYSYKSDTEKGTSEK